MGNDCVRLWEALYGYGLALLAVNGLGVDRAHLVSRHAPAGEAGR